MLSFISVWYWCRDISCKTFHAKYCHILCQIRGKRFYNKYDFDISNDKKLWRMSWIQFNSKAPTYRVNGKMNSNSPFGRHANCCFTVFMLLKNTIRPCIGRTMVFQIATWQPVLCTEICFRYKVYAMYF